MLSLSKESASPNSLRTNGWGRSDPAYEVRWLHSDIKDMAYYFIYKFFLQIKSTGGL